MGRYITTTGNAAVVNREVSSNYNAVVNDRIIADSSGGTFDITLPAAASLMEGDTIQIIDIGPSFYSNNVTVDRNGAKINGDAADLTLDVDGTILTLVYTGTNYGWVITGT